MFLSQRSPDVFAKANPYRDKGTGRFSNAPAPAADTGYRRGWGAGAKQHAPGRTDGVSIASIPPDDMKAMRRWLNDPNGRASLAQDQTFRLAERIQGNPMQTVTIHRAVPEGVTTINPGDWVTTSSYYARFHAQAMGGNGTNFHVISAEVLARDVYVSVTDRMGNGALNLTSLGYDPV